MSRAPLRHAGRRRALLGGLALALLAGCGGERKAREAAGAAYADSVAVAYGGWAAWKDLQYLRFDRTLREGGRVRSRSRHLWNLASGDCRYESDLATLGDYPPGVKIVAVVNRGTGAGWVHVERGSEATAPLPREDALLELARARIEEDGWALFLPFLLRETGTRLEDVGPTTTPREKRAARELLVRRKGAPDVRMFIDPATHKILETESVPEKGAPAGALLWRSEVNVGGIALVAERQESEERTRIFDLMAAPDRVPPEVFTDVGRRMPY